MNTLAMLNSLHSSVCHDGMSCYKSVIDTPSVTAVQQYLLLFKIVVKKKTFKNVK